MYLIHYKTFILKRIIFFMGTCLQYIWQNLLLRRVLILAGFDNSIGHSQIGLAYVRCYATFRYCSGQ